LRQIGGSPLACGGSIAGYRLFIQASVSVIETEKWHGRVDITYVNVYHARRLQRFNTESEMDYIGLGLIVGLFAVHLYSGVKPANAGLEEFVVAGRNQSASSVAASLLATILGASAIIGMADLAVRYRWYSLAFLGSGVVGLSILSGLIRRANLNNAFTLPQLVGQQAGPVPQILTGLVIVPAWIGIIAAQLIAVRATVDIVLPGSGWIGLVASGTLIAVYVALGGQKRVMRTDFWQLGFLVLLLSILAVSGLRIEPDPERLKTVLDFPEQFKMPMPKLIDMILSVGLTFLIGPDMISRLLTIKGKASQTKATLMAAGGLALCALMISWIGIVAGESAPLAAGQNYVMVLAKHTMGQLGLWFALVALMMALLSSMDTCLMSASSILSLDVLQVRTTRMIQAMAIVLMTVSVVVALALDSILPALMFSYTIYATGLGAPVALSLFTRLRIPAAGWVASIVVGGGIGALGTWFTWNYKIPIAFAASLGLVLSFTILAKTRKKDHTTSSTTSDLG
jgi:SSS family solute:Na+ symporter